ncbi:TetR/AcrR family transcriptional regulator [Ilumatobacter sp.]|uniref:TetR/AcrR family transcriptional regulator n=1 Tax=Ilumatobacter sp. TaxID=1967498 RepID=UPI003C6AAB39
MATLRTARERARDEVNNEILRVGREQLAEVGAAALSVRAVARELGMVSSAIYRYVASRDELLTRLIDAAYTSLGEAVEHDVEASADRAPADRWVGAALVVRAWAIERPHEYALLYGSPVPGYAAPERTSVSGTRASRALISIVRDATRTDAGDLVNSSRTERRKSSRERGVGAGWSVESVVDPELVGDFVELRASVDLDIDDDTLLDVVIAWTQLFGLVSFESFGQTRNLVQNHAALFESTARRTAQIIGLPDS